MLQRNSIYSLLFNSFLFFTNQKSIFYRFDVTRASEPHKFVLNERFKRFKIGSSRNRENRERDYFLNI